MDFRHWPAMFSYHHPNTDSGQNHAQQYGGQNWRSVFSSAAPVLVQGSDQFTLAKVGVEGMAERGSILMDCGAKNLRFDQDGIPTVEGHNGSVGKSYTPSFIKTEKHREAFNAQIRKNILTEWEEYKSVTTHSFVSTKKNKD